MQLVICAGMYRSASTWQYNVAAHILDKSGSCSRLGFVDGAQFPGCSLDANAESASFVLKCHDKHPDLAAALENGVAVALYSFRDLRDVAFSAIHKFRLTFEEICEPDGLIPRAVANDQFWRSCPGVLSQQYEAIVANPIASVQEIADHLRVPLCPADAAEVAETYSLDANRKRTAEIAARLRQEGVDLDDPRNAYRRDDVSQWHWNHIRDGKVGTWKEHATPRQTVVLALLCGRWLVSAGYERDFTWASRALAEQAVELDEIMQLHWRSCLRDPTGEEQLLAALKRRATQCERQVSTLQQQLAESDARRRSAEARLNSFLELGPFAQRVAQQVHRLAARHPRCAAAAKILLRSAT